MECVISPWWFYMMSIVPRTGNISEGVFVLSLMGLGVALFARFTAKWDEDITKAKTAVKFFTKVVVISGLLYVFVPSKDTLIQMLIAKNVTYDLVGQTVNIVEQVYIDIMALFG